MNKIISILKPTGMTSHDVVSRVRKILNIKKLVIQVLLTQMLQVFYQSVWKATKVCEVILNKDKSYICELTLGISTDTYDASGEILKKLMILNLVMKT